LSTIKLDVHSELAILSGDLIRQTVPSLSVKEINRFLQQKSVIINLAQVNKVDTAGLAWLLRQVELSQANACQLSFEHLPSSLIKLAALSAVDGFLPVHTSS